MYRFAPYRRAGLGSRAAARIALMLAGFLSLFLPASTPPRPAAAFGTQKKADAREQRGLPPQRDAAPPPSKRDADPPAKVLRLAQRTLRRYDLNANGRLEEAEWRKMPGEPRKMDTNGDGVITLEELTRRIASFGPRRSVEPAYSVAGSQALSPEEKNQEAAKSARGLPTEELDDGPGVSAGGAKPAAGARPPGDDAAPKEPRRETKFAIPAKRLPKGLPDWFLRRDLDGDGQITVAEFAPNPTPADLDEFARYDANRDGVITPSECLRGLKGSKTAPKKPPPR